MFKEFIRNIVKFFDDKSDYDKINQIIDNAYNSGNNLIKEAYDSEYEFRIKSNQEIRDLLIEVSSLYRNYQGREDIVEKTISHINNELIKIKNLNEKLEILRPNAEEKYGEPIYPLIDNKMEIVLSGAKDLLVNSSDDLLIGKLPENYQISDQKTPFYIANDSTIYGTSKGTHLKAALFELKHALLSNYNWDINWLDQSSIAHIVPIFDDIDIGEFKNSDYYFSDGKTSKGLVTIHSGYAFGGMRDHPRYLNNDKQYGPEDCSSWIAKLVECNYQFNTIDLYRYYKIPEGFEGKDKWIESDIGKDIISRFKPIYINTQDDIKPGLIYAYRGFGQDSKMEGLGTGGHVGVVLGVEDDNIIMLSDCREMPRIEGYIVSKFPKEDFYCTGDIGSIGYKKVFYLGVVEDNLNQFEI